eukprot:TRINITY_DN2069_c0_g1_i1.p1 TRINITY_DN2069_c0_g1~~TRINITY_DN2069_c0_g1_i1.p1  ORF type:complete len:153 (+),score=24.71 TRINITY_DN2069_c0_g1_i1:142-600(+)
MIRRPPRSTLSSSSAASDVYKRQEYGGAEAGMVVQGNGTWMGHLFPAMVLLATGTWWGTAALHRNRGRTPLYPPYGAHPSSKTMNLHCRSRVVLPALLCWDGAGSPAELHLAQPTPPRPLGASRAGHIICRAQQCHGVLAMSAMILQCRDAV